MRSLLFTCLILFQAHLVLGQDRLYSYICLSAQDRLCLGISPSGSEPVYSPNNLYQLQVKLREKIEISQEDHLKTRWSVFAEKGQIQLANFTTLCLAKKNAQTKTPGDIVLRPCDTQGDLEVWDLHSFIDDEATGAQIKLRSDPSQCLTLMRCERSGNHCNKNPTKPFLNTEIRDWNQRGSYIKMMPCSLNLVGQQFTQTIDCAPGCSPFMVEDGPQNVCNPECANDACNWDNGACATPVPTPPTASPSAAPTTQPTGSPTKTPTTSFPTANPTKQPTTKSPTTSGTQRPTLATSSPTLQPTVETSSPTVVGSSIPPSTTTSSPTTAPVPGTTTKSPTPRRTNPPTNQVTTFSPTIEDLDSNGTSTSSSALGSRLWYVWLILILFVLLLLCCGCAWLCGCCGPDKKKKKKRRNSDDGGDLEDTLMDSDSKMPPPGMPSAQEKRQQDQSILEGAGAHVQGPQEAATMGQGDGDMAIQDEPARKRTNAPTGQANVDLLDADTATTGDTAPGTTSFGELNKD